MIHLLLACLRKIYLDVLYLSIQHTKPLITG
ncbi:hypothetical protein [Clostridium phage Amboise]|nr:hypothetical protein [Clostridium phage Amboise]DAH78956.1 MAG TPA: hypothetical protein [Caudoviricetes sp.]